jgi:hypothetical protein
MPDNPGRFARREPDGSQKTPLKKTSRHNHPAQQNRQMI